MYGMLRGFSLKLIGTAVAVLLLSAGFSQGASVTLLWDANTEATLKGYKIYYKTGTAGPPYNGNDASQGSSPISVPLSSLADEANPEFTLLNLSDDQTYYLAVTAYGDTAESESDYSNGVEFNAGTHPPPPPPSPTTDIVMNPGFENGKTWWNFYTNGQGSFNVTGPAYSGTNAAKVTTNTGGTNIQLFQYGIPLEPNMDYQLSFSAYSSSGHGLRVTIAKHVSPYTNYGLSRKQIGLTRSWKTYTVNFRTKNFSASVDDARLMFWLADDAAPGDIFRIDDAVITKAGSSPPPPPPPPPPPTPTTDIVMNSGFESGKTWWNFYTNGRGSFETAGPAYSGTKAAKVTTNTGGTNIQLFQYGMPLEPNTDYRLKFNAYSSSGHDLRVTISKHVSPYTNYGLSRKRIDLSRSWKTYTVNFRTKNFSASVDDARLMFWLADDAAPGDIFRIDNVLVTPLN